MVVTLNPSPKNEGACTVTADFGCRCMTHPRARDLTRPTAPPGARGAWLIWVLAAALILPELLLWGADRGLWGSGRWRSLAYAYGGFWVGLLKGWRPNFPAQPWTMFLTYGFLHTGLAHLLGNLAALIWLTRSLLPRMGMGLILLIYGAAALAGAGMFGLLSQQFVPMVGASGAIFGLAGAWVATEAQDDRARGRPWRRVLARVVLIGAVLVVLNLFQWWLDGGRLAWQTHLGGFLAGAILAALWPRRGAQAGEAR